MRCMNIKLVRPTRNTPENCRVEIAPIGGEELLDHAYYTSTQTGEWLGADRWAVRWCEARKKDPLPFVIGPQFGSSGQPIHWYRGSDIRREMERRSIRQVRSKAKQATQHEEVKDGAGAKGDEEESWSDSSAPQSEEPRDFAERLRNLALELAEREGVAAQRLHDVERIVCQQRDALTAAGMTVARLEAENFELRGQLGRTRRLVEANRRWLADLADLSADTGSSDAESAQPGKEDGATA